MPLDLELVGHLSMLPGMGQRLAQEHLPLLEVPRTARKVGAGLAGAACLVWAELEALTRRVMMVLAMEQVEAVEPRPLQAAQAPQDFSRFDTNRSTHELCQF